MAYQFKFDSMQGTLRGNVGFKAIEDENGLNYLKIEAHEEQLRASEETWGKY